MQYVPLLDYPDGLAGGTSAVAADSLSVIGLMIASSNKFIGAESVAYFGAIVAAVCLASLVYNVNPQKYSWGYRLFGIRWAFGSNGYFTKTRVTTCGDWWHFVMEALSVIIQVISF